MKRSTLIGGLAVGFALAMTVSAPASAGPVQIIPWEESFTEVHEVGEEDWCPPDVVDFDVTYSFDGGGKDRITTQHDGIIRFAGTYKARATTYSANGKTLMVEIARATAATHEDRRQRRRHPHHLVQGSVTSTKVWLDGTFLFHDTGLVEGDFLVDHNGTPTIPDDDKGLGPVGEIGLHGRFDTADRDFCEDIAFYLAP